MTRLTITHRCCCTNGRVRKRKWRQRHVMSDCTWPSRRRCQSGYFQALSPATCDYHDSNPTVATCNRRRFTNLQQRPWAPAGFFSRGGQWGCLKDGRPPAGSGGSSPVGSAGKAPRNWRHFLKMMHKYFVYWGFTQDLQQKNTSTFPGKQVPPPPCPCLRAPMAATAAKATILSLYRRLVDPTNAYL